MKERFDEKFILMMLFLFILNLPKDESIKKINMKKEKESNIYRSKKYEKRKERRRLYCVGIN